MPSIAARATIISHGERRRRRSRGRAVADEPTVYQPPVVVTPKAAIYSLYKTTPVIIEASASPLQPGVSPAALVRGLITHIDITIQGEPPIPESEVYQTIDASTYVNYRIGPRGTIRSRPLYAGNSASPFQPMPASYNRRYYSGMYWSFGYRAYRTVSRRHHYVSWRTGRISATTSIQTYRIAPHPHYKPYMTQAQVNNLMSDPAEVVARQRHNRSRYGYDPYKMWGTVWRMWNASNWSSYIGSDFARAGLELQIRHPNFPQYYFNFRHGT